MEPTAPMLSLRVDTGDSYPDAPWATVSLTSAWASGTLLSVGDPINSGAGPPISTHAGGSVGSIPNVEHAPQPESPGGAGGIAGRIEPARGTLDAAVDAWVAYLRGRNRRESSIRSFKGEFRRAARALGWSDPSDVTFQAVTGWLGSHEWLPSTINRNLSIFRSFTRWAHAAGLIPADTLTLAQRAVGDGGPGARAATTDEARRIILEAWTRERVDKRAQRSPRSLYYACMFLAGTRKSEPGLWRWSDLLLDADPPVILWQPGQHKAGRREETAMAPELAGLLREWRAASQATLCSPGSAGGCAPGSPGSASTGAPGTGDLVFPSGLGKHTFCRDRDRCGIPEIDSRGRSLTPHCCRKWFATSLTLAGVHPRIIDRLMRHATGVQGRYVDAGLAEQAEALAHLPKIYPPQGIARAGFTYEGDEFGPGNQGLGIDAGAEIPKMSLATPMNTNHHNPQSPAPDARIGVATNEATRAGLSVLDNSPEAQAEYRRLRLNEAGSTSFEIEPRNGDVGTHHGVGSTWGGRGPECAPGDAERGLARPDRTANPDHEGSSRGRFDPGPSHSTFGVAGRDNRPTKGCAPLTGADPGYDAPGERPGHPIVSRGGGSAVNEPEVLGHPPVRADRPEALAGMADDTIPSGGEVPHVAARGFDSRPPHSALADFLACDAARQAALARLMREGQ